MKTKNQKDEYIIYPDRIRVAVAFIFAAIICIAGAFISLNMISNINNTDPSSNYSVEVDECQN